MNLLVAVDRNWAIGQKGNLLVTIPQDQSLFREETLNKVIVMGRKTLESLPGGKPLYGRTNLVLSREASYQVPGAVVCHSLEEALAFLEDYRREDVFIIGGQSIYEQFLPYCDVAHVTYVDFAYDADVYFPNLDNNPQWECLMTSEEQTYFSLCYEFRLYKKKA